MGDHARLPETTLARAALFNDTARIGGSHHERLDGRGYPRGLKAAEIEPETRPETHIVSVADVFDALTADRPYRKAMSIDKAGEVLRQDSRSALDPECVAALERAVARLEGDLKRAA